MPAFAAHWSFVGGTEPASSVLIGSSGPALTRKQVIQVKIE